MTASESEVSVMIWRNDGAPKCPRCGGKLTHHIEAEVIDGVKIWLNKDTWVLVRASGTEPLIRIYAEAKELEEAKNNAIKYKKKIASLLGG